MGQCENKDVARELFPNKIEKETEMEYIAKEISFSLEEWVFELLLAEEERKKKKKRDGIKRNRTIDFHLTRTGCWLKG